MDKISLAQILHHKLTRKEFLLYLFGILIAITGINSLLKILNPHSTSPSSSFGSGPYGGKLK